MDLTQVQDRFSGPVVDLGAICEFRFNPATHTDLKPATVPI